MRSHEATARVKLAAVSWSRPACAAQGCGDVQHPPDVASQGLRCANADVVTTVPYLIPTFAMLGPADPLGGPEVTSDVLLSKKVYVSPSTNIALAQLQRALRGFNATQVEKRTLADCHCN